MYPNLSKALFTELAMAEALHFPPLATVFKIDANVLAWEIVDVSIM